MTNAYERRRLAREAKRKARAREAYASRQAKRAIQKAHEQEQADIRKADALVHEQEIDPHEGE